MSLNAWRDSRVSEESNFFNPAYCGVLIYEFVRAYEKAKKAPAPFALVFCALPIALHTATRNTLPKTIITRLLPWLERNHEVRVGFAERACNLTPYVREAFSYAAARKAICFSEGGLVAIGTKPAAYTDLSDDYISMDVKDTVDAIRKIARWFAAAGETSTVLAAWGIRV